MKARVKVIVLLFMVAVLLLIPVTASANGAIVLRLLMPFNGFIGVPFGCDGIVSFMWFHEGPFPDAYDGPDHLLEGMIVLTPETTMGQSPELYNFKADGAQAWIWQASDLAAYCSDGAWDVSSFFGDFLSNTEVMAAMAQYDGNVSVKWNSKASNTHWKDSLVVTGEHLTLKSQAIFKVENGNPVALLNEFTQVNWH